MSGHKVSRETKCPKAVVEKQKALCAGIIHESGSMWVQGCCWVACKHISQSNSSLIWPGSSSSVQRGTFQDPNPSPAVIAPYRCLTNRKCICPPTRAKTRTKTGRGCVTSPEVIPQRQQGVIVPSCLELARGVQDTSHTHEVWGVGAAWYPLYTKEEGYDIIAISPIATWDAGACFVGLFCPR
jgi:hypothetical protein